VVDVEYNLVRRIDRVIKGTNPVEFIMIHETGNRGNGANARAHAKLQFDGNDRMASWNEQIDDEVAIVSFLPHVRTMHSGTSFYNNRAYAIEMCVNSDGDYLQTIANTIERVRTLMKEHNVPIQNVLQHHDASGKNCPEMLRSGKYGITWSAFISAITAKDTDMTPKESAMLAWLYEAELYKDGKGNPLFSFSAANTNRLDELAKKVDGLIETVNKIASK
jgi:N-acetylmuramoyl-L-alanine amidase CwlA